MFVSDNYFKRMESPSASISDQEGDTEEVLNNKRKRIDDDDDEGFVFCVYDNYYRV